MNLDSPIRQKLGHWRCKAQGVLRLTVHTGDGENACGLCAPEVLAAQGLQALSQGAVQAGLGPLPRRLEEGGEEPPEQAQQEGVSDQFGADDAWVHCVGGDPRA